MKRCNRCLEIKDDACFAKNSSRKDGLQGQCRQCKKETDAKHFRENRDQQKERNKKNRLFYSSKINEYKTSMGCLICNESDHCCLDFHHIHNKEFNIASWNNRGLGNRLWEEIAKCIVLCACCHRKLHAGRQSVVFKYEQITGRKLCDEAGLS